ncbi:uncharacterized protein LOC143653961 [Tamandua tetradactyla]|uniref:uncharacterized protein LOC143653961 n=1 Tax=Tamandua tetradactyla TaxID=48850 RepID=UPI0040547009
MAAADIRDVWRAAAKPRSQILREWQLDTWEAKCRQAVGAPCHAAVVRDAPGGPSWTGEMRELSRSGRAFHKAAAANARKRARPPSRQPRTAAGAKQGSRGASSRADAHEPGLETPRKGQGSRQRPEKQTPGGRAFEELGPLKISAPDHMKKKPSLSKSPLSKRPATLKLFFQSA